MADGFYEKLKGLIDLNLTTAGIGLAQGRSSLNTASNLAQSILLPGPKQSEFVFKNVAKGAHTVDRFLKDTNVGKNIQTMLDATGPGSDDILSLVAKGSKALANAPESLALFTPALTDKWWGSMMGEGPNMEKFLRQLGQVKLRENTQASRDISKTTVEEGVQSGINAVLDAMGDPNKTYSKWEQLEEIAREGFNKFFRGVEGARVSSHKKVGEGAEATDIDMMDQLQAKGFGELDVEKDQFASTLEELAGAAPENIGSKLTTEQAEKVQKAFSVTERILNPRMIVDLKAAETITPDMVGKATAIKQIAKDLGITIPKQTVKERVQYNPLADTLKPVVAAELKGLNKLSNKELNERISSIKMMMSKGGKSFRPNFDTKFVLNELAKTYSGKEYQAAERFLKNYDKRDLVRPLSKDPREGLLKLNEILDSMYEIINKKGDK